MEPSSDDQKQGDGTPDLTFKSAGRLEAGRRKHWAVKDKSLFEAQKPREAERTFVAPQKKRKAGFLLSSYKKRLCSPQACHRGAAGGSAVAEVRYRRSPRLNSLAFSLSMPLASANAMGRRPVSSHATR